MLFAVEQLVKRINCAWHLQRRLTVMCITAFDV